MNRTSMSLLVLICGGVMFLAGCKGKEEPAKTEKPVTVEEVRKEAGEAAKTTATYTRQQMDEYARDMEARLKDYDKKLDELQAGADKMSKEARAELEQQMAELRKKRIEAGKELEKLRSASGKAWDDMKAGLDLALDEMEKAYQRAASRFK